MTCASRQGDVWWLAMGTLTEGDEELRSVRLTLRLTPEEDRQLRWLAKGAKRPRSTMVALLIAKAVVRVSNGGSLE